MAQRSFYKIGKWEQVQMIARVLGKEMEVSQMLSLRRFGLKVEAIAVAHLSSQDLNWVPLKPATLAAKLRRGESEKILIATSSYFQSITSYVIGDTAYAGVKKGIRNSKGEIISDIAILLEYGGGNIPARPLWQPTFKEVMLWHVSNNTPESILVERMKKYGV